MTFRGSTLHDIAAGQDFDKTSCAIKAVKEMCIEDTAAKA